MQLVHVSVTKMKQIIYLFLFLLFILPVLSAGEFGAGTFSEGVFGFGTPEVVITIPTPSQSSQSSGGGSDFSIDFSKPVTMKLNIIKGHTYNLNINSEYHTYSIINIDISNQQAEFVFESERKVLLLNLNKSELLNYNDDNYYDFIITLTKIYGGGKLVEVTIKSIHQEIVGSGGGEIIPPEIIETPDLNIIEELQQIEVEVHEEKSTEEVAEEKSNTTIWILVFTLLLVIVYGLYAYFKSKKKEEKKIKDKVLEDKKKINKGEKNG